MLMKVRMNSKKCVGRKGGRFDVWVWATIYINKCFRVLVRPQITRYALN